MITLAAAADITPGVYRRVIYGTESLVIDSALLDKVAAHRAAFLRLLDSGVICYGVNTGFGDLVSQTIPRDDWAELQRNVLRARAAATA